MNGPLPDTSQALANALTPFPVAPYEPTPLHPLALAWDAIEPGRVIDGSMHSFRDTDLRVVRLAIHLGMPPQEFCPSHRLHGGFAAHNESYPTTPPTQVCQYDHTLLELLGMHDQWWEFSLGGGYFDLTEQAYAENLNETMTWALDVALDWLNGMGTTDTPQPIPNGEAIPLVRCHPAYNGTDHATGHSYVIDENSLDLIPNEEI